MTLRVKPAGRRPSRSSWETSSRRNLWLNVGFGLVVVVAALLLASYAAYWWYTEHLEPLARVGGQSITKDDAVARARIDLFRITYAQQRVRDEANAGRITAEQAAQFQESLNQQQRSLDFVVLEEIIDSRVQAALAAQQGVTVTDDEVAAKLTKEATIPEQRHVWLIEVEPEVDDDAEEPTPTQTRAARETAEAALADLEAGKTWEEVAKARSTALDAATGGDQGYVAVESATMDEGLVEELFALDDEAHTGVVEGEDGTFRIGRVTEIVPAQVNDTYQDEIVAADIPLEGYREAVRTDVVREKLEDKVVADALAERTQRRVAQIFIPEPQEEPASDAIKVRHILFSPNDDPQAAQTLPEADPAWKAAEDEARAAHARIKANPVVFDEIAREDTDDTASASTGGKQDYYDSTSSLDPAFAAAIFAPNLQPGQLLDPVKSGFGWHVIQIMYRPPDIDRARAIKTAADGGTDFAALVRSDSYGPEAADDGELGWIARFELDKPLEDAIFGTPVGKVSEPVEVDGDGIHIYKVEEEDERELTAEQRDTLEDDAFGNWYQAQKETFDICRVTEESGC